MSDTANGLLARLTINIAQVEDEASTPLDRPLFEECAIFGAHLSRDRATITGLVASLARLLPRLQQDPTPVVQLLIKVIEPLSFSDIVALDPPVDLVVGLHVSAQLFNPLVLSLLGKAATSTKDAAVVASMPLVVQSLVYLWLATPDVGIANSAALVLLELLTIDQAPKENEPIYGSTSPHPAGQGLIWRRFFGDRDVYGLLFSLCSLQPHSDQSLGKREKSVAQARLLDFLPKLGVLSWESLLCSHHSDIESSYGLDTKHEGLLHYACQHLVDIKNDVLIHMNLLQFYADLINTVRKPLTISTSGHPALSRTTSVSLDFLRSNGHHTHALAFYLDSNNISHDPLDRDLLYGPAAHYLSVYASEYPQAMLESGDIKVVLRHLTTALDISATQWAHGQSRKHDLNVLASLPRVALLPQQWLGMGRQSSPLLMIPCKNTNADALEALTTILRGPIRSNYENDFDGSRITHFREDYTVEAAATFAAYTSYLHYHDTFFTDIIIHADIVTLPEKAVAACNLLSSIIAADFHSLPSTDNLPSDQPPSHTFSLPSAAAIATTLRMSPGAVIPAYTAINVNGILLSPGREKLLPWLLRPRDEDGNTLLSKYGRESANYKVWCAQWNVFAAFYEKLKSALEIVEKGTAREKEIKGVLQAAEIRYRRENPRVWRPAGAEARVATLGM